ncbi:hypothetical protein K9O30_06845 [Clostridium bowmanii]|uniref:hypothetical protein n=1 Tax=Clostridium bowmanii TaxID=132925 RepID=UPI001C0E3919|nr:hypothetical protein [Clostridium bowmanii]MBU3191339.1 hypothetical protein [Clostridium bowmanii]MCA1073453.1 hypothetical protein [Clostridium bowmanii]
MTSIIKKKSKIIKRIFIGLSIVLIVAIVVLGLLWNRYLNKNSLLKKFETTQNQEVYLLGTFHTSHFNKWVNYSMEDLLSAVQNVQPDVVFIEAREQYFKDYGVVDGPIDMTVVYSHCTDNDIAVEMIDWGVVDNSFKPNTTNDKRDDMIFANIDNKLNTIPENSKILVVCGSGHFYEQTKRFLNNGFEPLKIQNKATYFESQDVDFKYPVSVEAVWKKRTYFYAYTYPDIVGQDKTLDKNIKSKFKHNDVFYQQQLEYCDLFSKNELYK